VSTELLLRALHGVWTLGEYFRIRKEKKMKKILERFAIAAAAGVFAQGVG